jgi:hypothetical protein
MFLAHLFRYETLSLTLKKGNTLMMSNTKMNIEVEWPTFLRHISEVLCSNLSLETYFPKFFSAHFPYFEKIK